MLKPKVIIRHCNNYDPLRIAEIIGEGMDELGIEPSGRTMVKPNTVIAHPQFFAHAFTRSEFLDGLLTAVQLRSEAVSELYVGERCGITIPTRAVFAMAGYPRILRKHRVKPEYFDEGGQVRVALEHPDALRDFILIPEGVARCDTLINAPKFKAHPWTKVTFSLKNYIGIQDDPQRLIDHDHMLHTKIADLQEVIPSKFIAIDGITAGQATMLTPSPFPLGLIIMGSNSVAVDSICTHIAGLDPEEVDHIRITAQRGYGPIGLDAIEITGDVSLQEAQERASGFHLTLERIDEIFNDRSNIRTYLGPPPDTYEYCWGGCPGSFFEAMQIADSMQPGVYHKVKPLHLVVGAYEGEIDAKPGEPVIFMGDCAAWEGSLHGRSVNIPFAYTKREHLNPYEASSGDVVAKLIGVMRTLLRFRGKPHMRARGCPVSVAENTLYLSLKASAPNPYLDPQIFFRFAYYWLINKGVSLWRRVKGSFSSPPAV
jgi:uncharacterized protein (DUF362 family)